MKKTNVWLVVAVIIPLVLLFWPFVMWNDTMDLILRVVPSLATQVLLCRIGRWKIVKAIPATLTGVFAAWGIYLYCTSPHWSNATLGGLVINYISPFICCVIVLITCLFLKKKK